MTDQTDRRKKVMKRELIITLDPINEAALVLKRSASSEAGAALYFSGIVRGSEEKEPIVLY